MRFLLLMMTSLAGIVCLWGGTLAEEVTSYSVLVSSWKKIKDGLFVFPITTDTILNGLSLEYTNETKQAETLKKNLTLFINNETEPIELLSSDEVVNLTRYNASHLLKPCRRNELRLRQFTFYTLHPKNAHLLIIDTTKYFHLYLFEPPNFNRSDDTLLCFLNDTGIGEYENWLVKFVKEDQQGNTSCTGVCVKDDVAAGHETNVYYDKSKHACVLKLPDPIEERDVGTYSCSLHIRPIEKPKIYLECHEKITINASSALPVLMIAISAVGVGIVVILVMIVPVIAVAKRHQKKAIDDNNEELPRRKNSYGALQDRRSPVASEDGSRSATPLSIISVSEQESNLDLEERRQDISSPHPQQPRSLSPHRSLKPPDSLPSTGDSGDSTSPEETRRDHRAAATRKHDGAQGTRDKGKKKRAKVSQTQEQKEAEDKPKK